MGADVISKADLQNLVTSVILRQTTSFSAQEICIKTREKLVGSSFADSEDVRMQCDETISTLYLIDCLSTTEAGRYKLAMSFPSVTKR